MFLCGAFTHGTRKPCKYCRNFMLWGVSTGACFIHRQDMSTWDHCKYFKRNSYMYTKDGICKHPEEEYV
jgi:hypothetical protein